jgi:hypothetical protein
MSNTEKDKKKDDQCKNIDLLLRIAFHKFDYQVDSGNSLENKAGVFLGFLSVVIVGIMALVQQGITFDLDFFTIGFLGLAVTLFLLILSLRTYSFLDPPDLPNFYSKEMLNSKNIDFENKVIADVKKSYENNLIVYNKKAKLYDHSLWLFLLSLILIFLGLL